MNIAAMFIQDTLSSDLWASMQWGKIYSTAHNCEEAGGGAGLQDPGQVSVSGPIQMLALHQFKPEADLGQLVATLRCIMRGK